MQRKPWKALTLTVIAICLTASSPLAAEGPAVTIENDRVKLVIAADGKTAQVVDKATGTDYCPKPGSPIAHVRIAQQSHAASAISREGDATRVQFGQSGVTAVLKAIAHQRHVVFEVVSLEGKDVAEFTFLDLPLTLKGTPGEPFAACALALNLKTNVHENPQPVSRPRAMCYPKFGFAGAQVALIACPTAQLRDVMKEAVLAAPDLPHSTVGGPWAMDGPLNRGSYVFNFGGLSEKTVDDWIKVTKTLGMSQIDFHGGGSFRFGDCHPNPEWYPNGLPSLKAVIDKLHAAGISAGLHTYAFFIAKNCPWVTPVPDARLAKDATFTLGAALTAEANAVPVVEDTKNMSTTTGFFVRNSVTLHIDDELITYSGISKEPPYAFTGCQRGACGTKPAAHAAGAKVHHLKECFGLFVPDPETTMLEEVAAKTAQAYNECGFDMIYLDALDGEDILGGGEYAWHYGSKYAFEICKRLKKSAVMEMSTFHHHLWYVRARMGAWDHPTRSHKRFIDIHCQANADLRRMFLPGNLGWWAAKTWSGIQGEPTFADDIEYLCGKAIGTEAGLSLMGIDPNTLTSVPVYQRLAGIFRQYEELRHANYFDESVKEKLREPGKDFTLVKEADGKWRFRRMNYAKHKVAGLDGWSNVWTTENPFAAQPLKVRIEALMSAGPYDAAGNPTLTDFADAKEFAARAAAQGVTVDLQSSTDQVKAGKCSGLLTAASAGQVNRRGAWARVGKTFAPPTDLSKHQAMGVWIHGDGKGEVLNFQLTGPSHISHGIGEHYAVVDFTGWRYVELLEPEGERYADYAWPYAGGYAIYREGVTYQAVENLNLYFNNVPPDGKTACYLSPIKALPLVAAKLKNPALTIDGKKIVFPAEMEPGSYIELMSPTDCKLYGPKGELVAEVKPQGEIPTLQAGAGKVTFTCDGPTDVNPRANVTVIAQGDAI